MAEEDKGQDRGIKLSFFGGFDMTNLSWLTYVMIILASYRLTHLIVFDKITEFIRKPFIKQEKTVDQNGRAVQKSPFLRIRLYAAMLLVCGRLVRHIDRHLLFGLAPLCTSGYFHFVHRRSAGHS